LPSSGFGEKQHGCREQQDTFGNVRAASSTITLTQWTRDPARNTNVQMSRGKSIYKSCDVDVPIDPLALIDQD
jgi:hypothetical protein